MQEVYRKSKNKKVSPRMASKKASGPAKMTVELMGPTVYDKSQEENLLLKGSLDGERGASGSSGVAGSS